MTSDDLRGFATSSLRESCDAYTRAHRRDPSSTTEHDWKFWRAFERELERREKEPTR